jgi:hypothetical protein
MVVRSQLHAPAALPPGKSPSYPFDRKLGGPQSRSGQGSEEKNSKPLPGLEPHEQILNLRNYTFSDMKKKRVPIFQPQDVNHE